MCYDIAVEGRRLSNATFGESHACDTCTTLNYAMDLTPLFTPALDTYVGGERPTVQLVDVYLENGKYSFDFSRLDDFIQRAFSLGIKYIEFSYLFSQWGAEFAPKIMAYVNGRYERIFGWETKSVSDEYIQFIDAFLPALLSYIEENGIKYKCYFHLFSYAEIIPRLS